MDWLKGILAKVSMPVGKLAAWIAGFLDGTDPTKSAKHLLMLLAGFTLCRGTAIIYRAIAHNIYMGHPIDSGAVYALGTMVVPVAALAGVAYLSNGEVAKMPPIPPPPPPPDAKKE